MQSSARGCLRYMSLQSIRQQYSSLWNANRQLQLAHYSSSGKHEKEKTEQPTWSQLASRAAGLAIDTVTKLGTSIGNVAGSLVPQQQSESTPRPGRRQQQSMGDFWPFGPAGRGGAFPGAPRNVFELLRQAEEQMIAQQSRQIAGLDRRGGRVGAHREDIRQRIESSEALRSRLGDVRVDMSMGSQSSSTSIVNGRRSSQTALAFPVVGKRGTATAQAVIREDAAGQSLTDIKVVLRGGETIVIDGYVGSSSGQASDEQGPTIEVEFEHVKK